MNTIVTDQITERINTLELKVEKRLGRVEGRLSNLQGDVETILENHLVHIKGDIKDNRSLILERIGILKDKISNEITDLRLLIAGMKPTSELGKEIIRMIVMTVVNLVLLGGLMFYFLQKNG